MSSERLSGKHNREGDLLSPTLPNASPKRAANHEHESSPKHNVPSKKKHDQALAKRRLTAGKVLPDSSAAQDDPAVVTASAPVMLNDDGAIDNGPEDPATAALPERDDANAQHPVMSKKDKLRGSFPNFKDSTVMSAVVGSISSAKLVEPKLVSKEAIETMEVGVVSNGNGNTFVGTTGSAMLPLRISKGLFDAVTAISYSRVVDGRAMEASCDDISPFFDDFVSSLIATRNEINELMRSYGPSETLSTKAVEIVAAAMMVMFLMGCYTDEIWDEDRKKKDYEGIMFYQDYTAVKESFRTSSVIASAREFTKEYVNSLIHKGTELVIELYVNVCKKHASSIANLNVKVRQLLFLPAADVYESEKGSSMRILLACFPESCGLGLVFNVKFKDPTYPLSTFAPSHLSGYVIFADGTRGGLGLRAVSGTTVFRFVTEHFIAENVSKFKWVEMLTGIPSLSFDEFKEVFDYIHHPIASECLEVAIVGHPLLKNVVLPEELEIKKNFLNRAESSQSVFKVAKLICFVKIRMSAYIIKTTAANTSASQSTVTGGIMSVSSNASSGFDESPIAKAHLPKSLTRNMDTGHKSTVCVFLKNQELWGRPEYSRQYMNWFNSLLASKQASVDNTAPAIKHRFQDIREMGSFSDRLPSSEDEGEY